MAQFERQVPFEETRYVTEVRDLLKQSRVLRKGESSQEGYRFLRLVLGACH